MAIDIIVVVLVLLLIYAWIGYPLLLAVTSRVAAKAPDEHTKAHHAELSRVAVLFSAHNEEGVIRCRLENLMQIQDLQVQNYVGVDGSTDRTARIAVEFAKHYDNVHICEFKERRGKVAVLKDLVKVSAQPSTLSVQESDILVFTDANTIFKPNAMEKLLAHFVDPEVGGVCGRLIFKENQSVQSSKFKVQSYGREKKEEDTFNSRSSEGMYWRWETWLKEKESVLDSCLGANGAIYAIRRELFWNEMPDNTVVDDFVIGMKVREQGFRMVYEPQAVAEEEMSETVNEWKRRVRIGAGDYQALQFCRRCLSPKYGRFAWMFWSHKVLRWFTPHLLAGLFVVSCLFPYTVTSIFLSALLFCGLLGRIVRRSRAGVFCFPRMCDYFLTMQVALFVGFLRFCRGNLSGQWDRTPRIEL